MKKIIFLGLIIISIIIANNAQSQMGMMPGGMGMMPGGMGCAMMNAMSPGMMGGGMGMMSGMGMMRGMMRMMDEEHPIWMHLAGLGLDEKQKVAIAEIKNRLLKETIRKKADLQIAYMELDEALDKEPADLKTAEALLKKIEALKTDIMLSHIKAKEEIKSKLTPEQRKRLADMMGMPGMGMMPMMRQMMQMPPQDQKDEMPGMKH